MVVEAGVGVLRGARIEVLHNVVGLGLEQMAVTVFNQIVLNLFPADEALVLPVDATEGSVGLELVQSG